MEKILVENAYLVSSAAVFRADLLAIDGKIACVGDASQWGGLEARRFDATGKLVLPGLIDAHCHVLLDTGQFRTPDNWALGSREAALGGITTLIDFVSPRPKQGLVEALNERLEEAKESIVDYHFHMTILGAGKETLDEMDVLPSLGISSLKLYTTYKPNYYCDDETILRVFCKAAELGLVSLVHCENDAIVTARTEAILKAGDLSLSRHHKTRPEIAEVEAVSRVLSLAEVAGACVVIAHNSCASTPRQVRQARARGVRAFCETAPQYVYLDESVYGGAQAWKYILQPPLRGRGELMGLRAALDLEEIDMMITDHCAYSREQKTGFEEIGKTPGGLPGFETLLSLTANLPQMTWPKLVRLLAENPAKIYGLWPQKGSLNPGADADFIILDDKVFTIDEKSLSSVAKYSPFHGIEARGRIEAVFNRGRELVRDGKLCDEPERGQFLKAETKMQVPSSVQS